MLQLFNDSIKKYGKINFYSKYNRIKKLYFWCVYIDLDNSFSFLLNKTDKIPGWIMDNTKFFFAFLSGYFDSESCLSIYYSKKRKYCNIQWVIKSSDKLILINIVQKLKYIGFNIKEPEIDKKAGTNLNNHNKNAGFPYKKDYWLIQTGMKSQVFSIINKMDLKHKEKIDKYKLSKELVGTNWECATEKITLFRNNIKNDVKNCMASSNINYIKKIYCQNSTLMIFLIFFGNSRGFFPSYKSIVDLTITFTVSLKNHLP